MQNLSFIRPILGPSHIYVYIVKKPDKMPTSYYKYGNVLMITLVLGNRMCIQAQLPPMNKRVLSKFNPTGIKTSVDKGSSRNMSKMLIAFSLNDTYMYICIYIYGCIYILYIYICGII